MRLNQITENIPPLSDKAINLEIKTLNEKIDFVEEILNEYQGTIKGLDEIEYIINQKVNELTDFIKYLENKTFIDRYKINMKKELVKDLGYIRTRKEEILPEFLQLFIDIEKGLKYEISNLKEKLNEVENPDVY